MTGIFFYKAKQGTRLPDNLLKHARGVKHRGQYRTWLLDADGCFAAIYLNKPQQHNLLVADGTQEEMARSFSVLDGSIEIRLPPSLESGLNLASCATQLEAARILYTTFGKKNQWPFSSLPGSTCLLRS